MDVTKGVCSFEPLDPADILSAVGTLSGHEATGLTWTSPGQIDDGQYLQWAVAEIQQARSEVDSGRKHRHTVNAVTNARRGLGSLVDWYLRRDGFAFCRDAPATSDQKSEVLVRRRIIDELAERVLARAIDDRNAVEHRYSILDVERAEDIIELFRREVESLRAQSDPRRGLCFFGQMLFSASYGATGTERRCGFHGWRGQAAIAATFDDPPWFGVVIPSSESKAIVRRVKMCEITTATWMKVLTALEGNFARPMMFNPPDMWKLLAAEAGLSTFGSTES